MHSVTVEAHEDLQLVRYNPKFPESVVNRWSIDNSIHALYLLRFFGGEVTCVGATHTIVEGPMPDCCTARIEFSNGATGRAMMDHFAPGDHRFEVRCAGATMLSVPGFSELVFRCRHQQPMRIELDDLDRKYKAGFCHQDETFVQSVLKTKPLAFPSSDLEDALKTMQMIDAIAGPAHTNEP